MTRLLFLGLCLFVAVSCNNSEPPASPANAVLTTFAALNAQDSVAFVESLTQDKRETYEANPQALHDLLSRWKGRHADVKIVSVANGGDSATTATIIYNLKVSGTENAEHDSLRTRAYLENGEWKLGY